MIFFNRLLQFFYDFLVVLQRIAQNFCLALQDILLKFFHVLFKEFLCTNHSRNCIWNFSWEFLPTNSPKDSFKILLGFIRNLLRDFFSWIPSVYLYAISANIFQKILSEILGWIFPGIPPAISQEFFFYHYLQCSFGSISCFFSEN